jgi:hypothetical protein
MQVPVSLFIKKIKAGVLGERRLGEKGTGRLGEKEKWGLGEMGGGAGIHYPCGNLKTPIPEGSYLNSRASHARMMNLAQSQA